MTLLPTSRSQDLFCEQGHLGDVMEGTRTVLWGFSLEISFAVSILEEKVSWCNCSLWLLQRLMRYYPRELKVVLVKNQ